MTNDPRPAGGEKLTDKDQYRLRQGNFGILYEIYNDVLLVVIIKIGDRKEVYRH